MPRQTSVTATYRNRDGATREMSIVGEADPDELAAEIAQLIPQSGTLVEIRNDDA